MRIVLRSNGASRAAKGLTLIEVMVAILILTVGAVAFLGTFGGISKSIRVAKANTLATNLAQEEIESLKNLSYYRLLVTSSAVAATEPGLGGFLYDNSYYPPEKLVVGQIEFERRVFIQKVSESAGVIVGNTWNSTDNGLKQISAYVIWQEGANWRKVVVNNLRDNPNRQKMDATIAGDVTVGGSPVSGASIYTLQNMLFGATSDGAGHYSFKVPAATYDVHVDKRGYFPATIRSTATASATVTVNFPLTAKAVGTVQGFAYLADHIVISEICAMVDGNESVEYVELYNPTPNAFLMSNAGVPSYRVDIKRVSSGVERSLTPPSETIYVNNVIPARGYFLIASSPTVQGVLADAYYSDAARVSPVPANRFPKEEPHGIRLVSEGINESSGSIVDALGFDRGASPWGPSGWREGNGFQIPSASVHGGLDDGETLERLAYSTSTHSMMDTAGIHRTNGNGYDNADNETDFARHNHSDSESPQNATMNEQPGAGTPAIGAAAFMDDGLSASAVAIGIPMPGSFTVTNVATGTWNLVVSSGGYVYEQSNIIMTAGVQVDIGSIFISSPASKGYLSGRVLNSGGAPLNNIKVESSFGTFDYSDTSGLYRFQIDGGTHIVTANPNNLNTQYTIGEATDVIVNVGEAKTVPDIFLFQGGTVSGFVSTNGTDPLPGIPMVATNTAGFEVGATVTDSYGYFYFPNLAIGAYGITPQLEPGESSTPAVLSATITAGGSVFAGTMTVSNAFGKIDGTVKVSGKSITTGVLIVAVPFTTNIAGVYPPTNDQTLRNGSVVYYICSSDSDGTYSLPVRGGTTYNVYAWYTTFSNGVADPQKRTSSATLAAGATAVVPFTW